MQLVASVGWHVIGAGEESARSETRLCARVPVDLWRHEGLASLRGQAGVVEQQLGVACQTAASHPTGLRPDRTFVCCSTHLPPLPDDVDAWTLRVRELHHAVLARVVCDGTDGRIRASPLTHDHHTLPSLPSTPARTTPTASSTDNPLEQSARSTSLHYCDGTTHISRCRKRKQANRGLGKPRRRAGRPEPP